MRKLTTFIFVLISFFKLSNTSAANYYFLAMEDNAYENPANWSPAYPGNEINEKDKVYIQADAYFNNFELIINGHFEVVLGTTLYGNDNKMLVKKSGCFVNNGDAQLSYIENEGKIENGMDGNLLVQVLANKTYSSFFNLQESSFTVKNSCFNEGTLNLAGKTNITGNIQNFSKIEINSFASFVVMGTLSNSASSEFISHDKSLITINKCINADKISLKAGRNINYTELMFANTDKEEIIF